MSTYFITEANRGYIIRDYIERGMMCQEWAFSTLKEAQEYLPTLFEPKQAPEGKKKP